MSGVLNGSVDVFAFEESIVSQDFREACPIGKKLKDVSDANALAANAWTASALAFFQRDSFQSVGVHIRYPTAIGCHAVAPIWDDDRSKSAAGLSCGLILTGLAVNLAFIEHEYQCRL